MCLYRAVAGNSCSKSIVRVLDSDQADSVMRSLRLESFLILIHTLPLLLQIVQRYDIVLIQELRDSSATVIQSFLEVVNE